jgi:mono/diheme cytochrome c family protein
MKRGKILLLGCLALVVLGAIYEARLIRRGVSATDEPSGIEKLVARTVRNLSIPARARKETNPWKPTAENLEEARDQFLARCAICHGTDGSGVTQVGRNLYPKPPDLRAPETQDLTDGQIHYIIQKGVRLTGMPAWGHPRDEADQEGWKLVLFIRSLRPLSGAVQSQEEATARTAHYTGSPACGKCHQEIYDRWKETPMANVVRDPREHPDAIFPNLASDPFAKFSKDQVALVYGSIWKQRYFTRIGDDYYPEPAQWDVTHHVWRPYFVAKGTDWWEPFYPPR